jgi:hypothetical protein
MPFHVIARTQIVNFEEHVTARWNTWRGGHEVILGVFQFHPAEWEAFLEICANANIEVTYERTTVQA